MPRFISIEGGRFGQIIAPESTEAFTEQTPRDCQRQEVRRSPDFGMERLLAICHWE